jgi:hypothetical protein
MTAHLQRLVAQHDAHGLQNTIDTDHGRCSHPITGGNQSQ